MSLFYETPDGRARLYLGDSRHLLVEDESIDMIATSPPYWGKRDYGEDVVTVWGGEDGCEHEWDIEEHRDKRGIEGSTLVGSFQAEALRLNYEAGYCSLCGAWRGQLGLEPTWQEYIAHLCECAEEWWRVLKPTGNLFVNMGDTFATHTSKRSAQFDGDIEDGRNLIYTRARPPQNYPEKSKLGIPYRLRFALNDMGWVGRADIIWYKGKDYGDAEYIARSGELIRGDGDISKVAMPESSRREACSYEMVFRFAKTSKMNYYVHERTEECRTRPPSKRVEGVDFEWVEHAACEGKGCDKAICHDGMIKSTFWHGYSEWFDLDAVRRPHRTEPWGEYKVLPKSKRPNELPRATGMGLNMMGMNPAGANPGDVWIIQPEPFKEAHYAVWPSKLCEMMIQVGCPKEVCPKCGKPRERIVQIIKQKERDDTGRTHSLPEQRGGYAPPPERGWESEHHTIGWSDCGCGEGFVPGVVADFFGGGSARLQERALFLGRNAIMMDMKEEYLEMAKKRLLQGVLL